MDSQKEAIDFYETVVEGTRSYKNISLEAKGKELEGFEMHPVSKQVVADIVDRLPDEMFEEATPEEGVDVDEDVDPEDLEQEIDGNFGITKETVDAFEDLCMTSLEHKSLSKTQIADIIEEFDFDVLFELGTEILDLSIENAGKVKDFRVQS